MLEKWGLFYVMSAEQVAIATYSCGIAAKLHKNGSF